MWSNKKIIFTTINFFQIWKSKIIIFVKKKTFLSFPFPLWCTLSWPHFLHNFCEKNVTVVFCAASDHFCTFPSHCDALFLGPISYTSLVLHNSCEKNVYVAFCVASDHFCSFHYFSTISNSWFSFLMFQLIVSHGHVTSKV